MKATSYPSAITRLAAPWLLVGGAALLSGALAAGKADIWLGQTPALLLLAVLVGITFLAVFAFLGSTAVVIWPVAATGGYLLQMPRSHPVITFDRLWIGGVLAYIALDRARLNAVQRHACSSRAGPWPAPRPR